MTDLITANRTRWATPRLVVLSEDQKETIFSSVLDVLETKGVRVDNQEGLELLSGAGALVGAEWRHTSSRRWLPRLR